MRVNSVLRRLDLLLNSLSSDKVRSDEVMLKEIEQTTSELLLIFRQVGLLKTKGLTKRCEIVTGDLTWIFCIHPHTKRATCKIVRPDKSVVLVREVRDNVVRLANNFVQLVHKRLSAMVADAAEGLVKYIWPKQTKNKTDPSFRPLTALNTTSRDGHYLKVEKVPIVSQNQPWRNSQISNQQHIPLAA